MMLQLHCQLSQDRSISLSRKEQLIMCQERKNYVVPYPDPNRPFHVVLVSVPFEIWKEITRENDRIRKRMQYHGRCKCPRTQICFCTEDCANCMHQTNGDILSLDYDYATDSDSEVISMYETLEDKSAANFPEQIAQEALVEKIIAYLQQAMPEALQVLQLQIFDGLSERQALKILGITRSTYRSRLQVIKDDLISKFDLNL